MCSQRFSTAREIVKSCRFAVVLAALLFAAMAPPPSSAATVSGTIDFRSATSLVTNVTFYRRSFDCYPYYRRYRYSDESYYPRYRHYYYDDDLYYPRVYYFPYEDYRHHRTYHYRRYRY